MRQYDRTKLPVWAQDDLNRLERDLAVAEAKLAEGPADSTVFIQVMAETEKPVGNGKVSFRSDKARFQVGFDPETGNLEVTAWNGRVAVYPQVTNSVVIKSERH